MALMCRCSLIFIFMSCSWALGFELKVSAFRSEEPRVLPEVCSEDQGLGNSDLGPSVYVGGEEEGESNAPYALGDGVKHEALHWKAGLRPHQQTASSQWGPGVAPGASVSQEQAGCCH